MDPACGIPQNEPPWRRNQVSYILTDSCETHRTRTVSQVSYILTGPCETLCEIQTFAIACDILIMQGDRSWKSLWKKLLLSWFLPRSWAVCWQAVPHSPEQRAALRPPLPFNPQSSRTQSNPTGNEATGKIAVRGICFRTEQYPVPGRTVVIVCDHMMPKSRFPKDMRWLHDRVLCGCSRTFRLYNYNNYNNSIFKYSEWYGIPMTVRLRRNWS